MIIIKDGTMIINRHRQYYQPAKTILFSGDRKLVKIVSRHSHDEYIYVPVSYRHGRVHINGDYFMREFPHRYHRNRSEIYRNISLGDRSKTLGRGLTIRIIKQ